MTSSFRNAPPSHPLSTRKLASSRSQNITFKQRSDDSSSRRGCNSFNIVQFKNSCNQNSNLCQKKFHTDTNRRVVMSKSIGKKIILQFKHSNSTTSREVSALPGQLGKTDRKSEYFQVSKGISNSTQKVDQNKNGNQRK